MKITKYAFFAVLLVTALGLVACQEQEIRDGELPLDPVDPVDPIVGGDVDEYGCKPSAGYSWCPSLDDCVRVWETLCPEYEEFYKGPMACTREYMPVTGQIVIPSLDGEEVITKTFGNRCEAEAAGASNIELVYLDEEVVSSFDDCVARGNLVMESFPEQCIHDGQLFIREVNFEELDLPEDKFDACEVMQGTPLPQFNQCEYISQDACDYLGGEFLECASACRNDPNAEICTLQCVQVCVFN